MIASSDLFALRSRLHGYFSNQISSFPIKYLSMTFHFLFRPSIDFGADLSVSSMASEHEMAVSQGRQSESKSNFILPSVQSSHPSSMLASLLPCNMFFTGYLDCAQEALRYLLEVERLPLEHPLVHGLQCQLYDTYCLLQLQYQFDNHFHASAINADNCENTETPKDSQVQPEHPKQTSDRTENTSVVNNGVLNSGVNSKQCASVRYIDANDAEISEKLKASNLSAEAQEVAVALAEQIYSMLNGGDAGLDSDVESLDEESVDEGFEEMTGAS